MADTLLENMGLSKKEADLYLVMLKIGAASAAQIARDAEMPRQTVYSLLNGMIDAGFVYESDHRGVKQFFVEPERLLALLEHRKDEADRQRMQLEQELPKMLARRPKKATLPKVQYYEGEQGLRRLFEQILEQYKKGERDIFRGYGINQIKELLHNYIPDFIKERYELGGRTHLLIGQGPDDFGITNDRTAYGRSVKRLNMPPQQAGVYIVGNRLYLFSYEDLAGVMIENAAITRLLKHAFEDHWKRVEV